MKLFNTKKKIKNHNRIKNLKNKKIDIAPYGNECTTPGENN